MVVSAVGIGAIALFIQLLTAKNVTSNERSRVWAFIPLWIANAIFWALYQQQFTVIPIYSEVTARLAYSGYGSSSDPRQFPCPYFR